MNYFILIIFGFLPSIIWLLFYLRKDAHPEPKAMVLKIFFLGMIITIPTAGLEILIFKGFNYLPFSSYSILLLNVFIGVAFIEEIMKYAIIRQKVLKSPEFDEPVDGMIYMIIAALGFAAIENLLILFPLNKFFEIFTVSALRFLGATFLHILCSAVIGYFLALYWFEIKKSKALVFVGIGIAVILHGIYNFSIIAVPGNLKFVAPLIILIGLSVFVSIAFRKLKLIATTSTAIRLPRKPITDK